MSAREWLESRVGGGELWDWIVEAPAPGGPSWARASSVGFLVAMAMAGLSGLGLSITYAPAGAGAWASVFFTEHVLPGGWFVRSLHMASTEASIVFGLLALTLSVLEGRYKGRRDLPFWCLALVAATTFVFAITGNPLRWDNRGFFGFQTEANIAAELPLVGRLVRGLLVGGSSPNNWTLTRLYAGHTLLLPVAVAVILSLWLRSSRRAALSEASAQGGSAEARYGDAQLPRDLGFALISAAFVTASAYVMRAPLEAPADALASYNARPEWYFVGLYVLRNAVPTSTQGLVASSLPLVLGLGLVALPLLDRDPRATLKKRAPLVGVFLLGIIGFVGLTIAGVLHDARDPDFQVSKRKQAKVDRRAIQVALADGVPPAGALAMMHNDPVLRSEDLFKEKCATCHQLGDLGPADGKTTAPKLDGWGSEQWVLALLDDPDSKAMFGGSAFEGKMPSYTKPPKDPQAAANFKPMPKEQQAAIARWLAGEAQGAPAGHDAEGEKLVKQRCTTCHLLRGETDDAEGVAPELSGWASLRWTRAQIANPGTMATYRPASLDPKLEGHMPRFDGDLSAADLDLLTRFVLFRAAKKAP